MPVYMLLLIAVLPVLAMVATAGDALGRDTRLAALVALAGTLATVLAWLVAEGARGVAGIWRRAMTRTFNPRYGYRAGADRGREPRLRG